MNKEIDENLVELELDISNDVYVELVKIGKKMSSEKGMGDMYYFNLSAKEALKECIAKKT